MIRRSLIAVLLAGAACSTNSAPESAVAPEPAVAAVSTAPGGARAVPGAARLTFESGPVRSLALSPDGSRVFVANTPNGSLDVLRVGPAGLVVEDSVKVGLDPVAVAVRSDREVWVVNHVSDSVSIVDVSCRPPRDAVRRRTPRRLPPPLQASH